MLRVEFRCMRCLQSKRVWSSSRVFGGHYLANQKYVNTCASYVCNMTRGFLHFRMVHAFTCAGILQSMTSLVVRHGYYVAPQECAQRGFMG